jgi:hypothetical protein
VAIVTPRPLYSPPRQEPPGTHWIGCCVGPGSNLDAVENLLPLPGTGEYCACVPMLNRSCDPSVRATPYQDLRHDKSPEPEILSRVLVTIDGVWIG